MTFSYIGNYWNHDPFVQPAQVYDPAVTDANRAAQSLPIVPLYRLRDNSPIVGTGGNCVPDSLPNNNFSANDVILYAPFTPYGKKSLYFDNTPAPSDLLWSGAPLNVNAALAVGPLTNLSRFLNDSGRSLYEGSIAGDRNGDPNDRNNPYERESMLTSTATPYTGSWVFDPSLPAEGYNSPVRGQVYTDPQTGRPLINALDNTPTYRSHIPNDLALETISTGYEISTTDEGSRFPVYDFFHDPDDACFNNPYPATDPGRPFQNLLEDLYGGGGSGFGAYLPACYNQQITVLGFLASGLGFAAGGPSANLLFSMAYNDAGDQGGNAPTVTTPDSRRNDRDLNGLVDEPIRRFPDSIKEIIDVSGIGPATFDNMKHLVTLYSGPNELFQLFNSVNTAGVPCPGGTPAAQLEPVEDPVIIAALRAPLLAYCALLGVPASPPFIPKVDLYSPPAWPTNTACFSNLVASQDCIIDPNVAFLQTTDYQDARDGWASLAPIAGNVGLIDPEIFYAFVNTLCDSLTQVAPPTLPKVCANPTDPTHLGLKDRWTILDTYLRNLFNYQYVGNNCVPNPAPGNVYDFCLLSGRITGHWFAWSYFYAYYNNTAAVDCRNTNASLNGAQIGQHGRYHGIADMLQPLPPLGPYYDPGNYLGLPPTGGPNLCRTAPAANRTDFPPRLYVPVDIGAQCTPAPPGNCNAANVTPNGVLEANPADPYCELTVAAHNYNMYPDCFLRLWGSADPNISENNIPNRGGNNDIDPPCARDSATCGLMVNPAFYIPDTMPLDPFSLWGGLVSIPAPGCKGQGNCFGWGKCPPNGKGNKKGCGGGGPVAGVNIVRLNDETILFELTGEVVSASTPYRTYQDSPFDNEVDIHPRVRCESAGLMAAVNSTTNGAAVISRGNWQEADGRDPGLRPFPLPPLTLPCT
ncbi:MAG: hypothetical protein ACREJQ_03575, partial [bacterium]